MNIRRKLGVLLLGSMLVVGCAKSTAESDQPMELDWSRTGTLTLEQVAMASSSKASQPMAVGQSFRLYAVVPKTKEIVATTTYTIDAATAGKPVADSAKEEVVLPYGDLDIFLVGPVKATVYGAEFEIASATKVTPMVGVDLISSRTRVRILKSKTPIVATPLEHRMVKLELEVSMLKDDAGSGVKATYQDATLLDPKHGVSIENLGSAATFSFDDNGGSIKSTATNATFQYTYAEGNTGLDKIVRTSLGEGTVDETLHTQPGNTGAVYTVTSYVFPSDPTTPKMGVTLGYWKRVDLLTNEVAAHAMSGKTPLAQKWEAGTYVKLSTQPIPNIDLTIRPEIKPWDDGGTTGGEIMNNTDLLFWYSGEDAPEMIDGKLCWRDRSGNGYHAELSGDIKYDAASKSYYTTNADDYFKIPALGAVPEYTLELTLRAVNEAKNSAVDFSGTAGMFIHMPYMYISWYSAGENTYDYGRVDKYIFEQLQSYAFCRNASKKAILVNGVEKISWDKPGSWSNFDDNKLWRNTTVGGVGKQRLYGARMYKKYLNDATGQALLKQNYANKLSQLGMKIPATLGSYVTDGLICQLDGRKGYQTIDGKECWVDQSLNGNHVQKFGTPGSGSNYYSLDGNVANYYKFVKSLGKFSEITVEIVTSSDDAAKVNQPLIANANDVQYPGMNIFAVWWPYDTYNGVLADMPFHSTSPNRIAIKSAELVYPVSQISQLSVTKSKAGLLTFRQNGYSYTSKNTTNSMAMPELNKVYLGAMVNDNFTVTSAYKGKIYMVRIYNRALSDFERQYNYLVDKQAFSILP